MFLETCLAEVESGRSGELPQVLSPSRLLFPISWPASLDPTGEMGSQLENPNRTS